MQHDILTRRNVYSDASLGLLLGSVQWNPGQAVLF